MTGKVFSNSANIYQDQAKILFDYYKAAAESIVNAEINEEKNKEDLTTAINSDTAKMKTSTTMLIIFFCVAGVTLILGLLVHFLFLLLAVPALVFAIKSTVDRAKYSRSVAEKTTLLAETEKRYADIRRDYKVYRVGVVYVPVATRVPFEDQSFVLDHTGEVPETSFRLTVLRQPEDFQQSVQQLTDTIDRMPIVETNEQPESVNTSDYSTSMQNITLNDYVGNIDRQVRNISYLLGENDDVSVKIPVITPTSAEAENIRSYSTDNVSGHPVIKVFDVAFEDRLKKFSSLNALKDQIKDSDNSDSNEYMKRLMKQLADSVQILTKTRISGTAKLADYTSSIFNMVLKSAYTQYSPALEAEEIERVRATEFDYKVSVNDYTPFSLKSSSVVRYDMFSNNWVAEDGSRTSMPFGMHQIDEEIFMPLISTLMEENRVERLKIYNNIDDQKRMYLERWQSEVGNYFRDNRKTADELITHMRETYADYMNAYNMYKSLSDTSGAMKESHSTDDAEVKELDSQAEMIAGFEEQAAQCNRQQEEFADFMDRIQESIRTSTQEFSHIEFYEGSLRDMMPHQTARGLANFREYDSRRRALAAINPYIAECAELPPEPMTSPEVIEHMSIDLNRQAENETNDAEYNV